MPKRKYKTGDRVKVINQDRWCVGCIGVVKGAWDLPKAAPYYLVHLENRNLYMKDTYVYEGDIEKA